MRSNSKQEQTTAATNLQDAAGFESENAFHRVLNPLTHFLGRDRVTGVAAIPTSQVEGRISNFTAIHLVVKLTPLRNVLGAPVLIQKIRRTRFGFRNYVCN